MPTMPFYFCTLEEYYTGGLFLGVGNGVTDGSVLMYLMFLFTGFKGNDIWLTEIDSSSNLTLG